MAGPIVRSSQFLPQCVSERRATGRQLGWGLTLMVVGLFNKVVIADSLMAPVVEAVYDASARPDFAAAWIGTLAFSVQIFCDFAGYSTCAIGVAMCLGFALPDNFRFPYAAGGFSDFWRRWHVSLSSWLRDYLYIPLGGNRVGRARTYANLMITMLLGGLWHGATWTFVAWGGLHGLYLAGERVVRKAIPGGRLLRFRPAKLAVGLATFAVVCWTWAFFRAKGFERGFTIAAGMLGFGGDEAAPILGRTDEIIVLVVAAVTLALHWFLRDQTLEAAADRLPWPARSAILAGMLAAICLSFSGEDRAFIYFQF